jgi:predicted RNA-binding protein Jag
MSDQQTVTTEGGDLKTAIGLAAEQLGLHPAQVDYKLDLNHFRSAAGLSLARSTVRIVAWNSGRDAPGPGAAPAARPERARPERARPEPKPRAAAAEAVEDEEQESGPEADDADGDQRRRRRRKRGPADGEAAPLRSEEAAVRSEGRPEPRSEPRSERSEGRPPRPAPSKPENLRGAEGGTTEASDFAEGWFRGLLQRMGVDGTVTASGSAERVHLAVKAERAGRIVGKRGATLGSVRHLLGLALEQRFGPLTIDVDVGDDRPREDLEPRSFERGPRPERPRGGPPRGGGGRDRGGDRERSGDRGRYPEEKLRALAQRAAEKAVETGQTITINLELNSFDRRIVHLEVANLGGVESRSEERTGADGRLVKYIQIMPAQG